MSGTGLSGRFRGTGSGPTEGKSRTVPLLAIGGLLVALVGGYTLYSSANSGVDDSAATPAILAASGSTAARTGSSTSTPSLSPTPILAAVARDIFDQTFVSVAAKAPVATAPVGSGAPGGAGASAGGRTASPAGGPTIPAGVTVTLGLTSTTPTSGKALVTVNRTSLTVTTGQSFAQYFTLVSLYNNNCALFTYGTSSIDLCKGASRTFTTGTSVPGSAIATVGPQPAATTPAGGGARG